MFSPNPLCAKFASFNYQARACGKLKTFLAKCFSSAFHFSSATSTEADENESAASLDDINAIKSKLNAVKKLRLEVEGLRKFLSDQYAEDIGNNCRMQ